MYVGEIVAMDRVEHLIPFIQNPPGDRCVHIIIRMCTMNACMQLCIIVSLGTIQCVLLCFMVLTFF